MGTSEQIARLAGIFSDPTRVKLLILLMEAREGMTTMDLSTRLGVLQPRVSSHLSILLKHDAVLVTERGRQRIYKVSPKVASLVKDLSVMSGSGKILPSSNAIKEVKNNSAIRQCRSCYDHLAGVAGVELLEDILCLGWLTKTGQSANKVSYRLTRTGIKSLEERGVDLVGAQKSNRTFAYGCLDWTEREPHLGGSLGSAVLNSMLSTGIVERKTGTRALKLVKPISSWLKRTNPNLMGPT
jgi:DNA-binding transcriptional ArsR family regulator